MWSHFEIAEKELVLVTENHLLLLKDVARGGCLEMSVSLADILQAEVTREDDHQIVLVTVKVQDRAHSLQLRLKGDATADAAQHLLEIINAAISHVLD